jgi:hypothetical protein
MLYFSDNLPLCITNICVLFNVIIKNNAGGWEHDSDDRALALLTCGFYPLNLKKKAGGVAQ